MIDTYLRESLDTDEHERATGGWVSRENRAAGADGLDHMLDDYEEALRENDLKFIKRRAQELADTYNLTHQEHRMNRRDFLTAIPGLP
jgi:hypothetical protein